MNGKMIIYLLCSVLGAVCSAVIAYLIWDNNYEVILNITFPAFGLAAGITSIVLAINAIKEKAPKWLCILIMVISLISSGMCLLNFMACVVCISLLLGIG